MTELGERVPFELLVSLREHLYSGRSLALLTVASISTSVALATGLEMTSRAVEDQLELTAQAVGGATKIEVVGGTLGIQEHLLSVVQQTPGVLAATPFSEATLNAEPDNFPLHILGIDLTEGERVRSYAVSRDGLQVNDPIRLMANPNSVIVTRELADRLERRQGQTFPVRSKTENLELRIEGILEEGGVASAFGGQVAVMDIYGLQHILKRDGWIDRIDVVPIEGIEINSLVAELRARLGGVAQVRPALSPESYIAPLARVLRTVVLLMAAAGVIVSCFLSYAAMTTSVARRAVQLALLRVTGLEAVRVRRIILIESLFLSLLGSAIGLAAGLEVARILLPFFSAIMSSAIAVEIGSIRIGAATIAITGLVGVAVALSGGIVPARRAVQRFALDALIPSGGARDPLLRANSFSVGVLASVAASVIAALLLPSEPVTRVSVLFIASLALIIACASPLVALVRTMQSVLERVWPGVGLVVGTALVERPTSTLLTVAAIAGVIATASGIGIAIESLAASVVHVAEERYADGILITAGSPIVGPTRGLISHDMVDLIRATPGVRAVDEQYNYGLSTIFQDKEVYVGALSMDVIAKNSSLSAVSAPSSVIAHRVAAGEIAVSERFARVFGVSEGAKVELSTPKGPRTFIVAGVVRSFDSEGRILFDIAVFDSLWPRQGATALAVFADDPKQLIVDEIRKRVNGREDLFFTYGDQLRKVARTSIERFSGLLYSAVAVALTLGGIAVASLLLGAVADRRRELALLRVTGATARHLMTIVVADGLVVSVGASAVGLTLGYACSYPLVDLLNGTFTWSLEHSVNVEQLLLLASGACLLSILAAVYPAWAARRTLPTDIFAPE